MLLECRGGLNHGTSRTLFSMTMDGEMDVWKKKFLHLLHKLALILQKLFFFAEKRTHRYYHCLLFFGHPAKLRQCQTEKFGKTYSLKYYILNELWGENDLELETWTEKQNEVIKCVGKKRKKSGKNNFRNTLKMKSNIDLFM